MLSCLCCWVKEGKALHCFHSILLGVDDAVNPSADRALLLAFGLTLLRLSELPLADFINFVNFICYCQAGCQPIRENTQLDVRKAQRCHDKLLLCNGLTELHHNSAVVDGLHGFNWRSGFERI
jgi:hypothetical protein